MSRKRSKKTLNDTPKRWKEIKKKYGLSKEDYIKISEDQEGKCFICGRDPYAIRPFRNLSVDHDHTTGRIRGLLCYRCNHKLLGWYIKDRVDMAERLVVYLTRNTNYGKVPE